MFYKGCFLKFLKIKIAFSTYHVPEGFKCFSPPERGVPRPARLDGQGVKVHLPSEEWTDCLFSLLPGPGEPPLRPPCSRGVDSLPALWTRTAVSMTAQCSVDDPVPSRVLNLLKAAHATCPLGESRGDPAGCRGLAGSLGVVKGDHAQVPCGVRDTRAGAGEQGGTLPSQQLPPGATAGDSQMCLCVGVHSHSADKNRWIQ